MAEVIGWVIVKAAELWLLWGILGVVGRAVYKRRPKRPVEPEVEAWEPKTVKEVVEERLEGQEPRAPLW
jgi:hypothetical protein